MAAGHGGHQTEWWVEMAANEVAEARHAFALDGSPNPGDSAD